MPFRFLSGITRTFFEAGFALDFAAAGFLAGATQAPLTAVIIVMGMVTGHEMVLSLLACAFGANALARLVSPSLYATLAQMQLQRLPLNATPDATPSASLNSPERP